MKCSHLWGHKACTVSGHNRSLHPLLFIQLLLFCLCVMNPLLLQVLIQYSTRTLLTSTILRALIAGTPPFFPGKKVKSSIKRFWRQKKREKKKEKEAWSVDALFVSHMT